jgi:sugar phosphate isomerase/epimerase
MYYTGFADEAAEGIAGQTRAIQDLGWSHIELRSVDGKNITDISDDAFKEVVDTLGQAQISVNAFGSTICNWGKSVLEPMDVNLQEAERAIPRMKALGTRYIRIMSFGILHDRDPEDQFFEKRVESVQQIVDMFAAEGLVALHENCANYGGMGWQFTKRLLDHVHGLRLIYDTANSATSLDRSKPKPYPVQTSWEFYKHIKPYIEHVHIKDGIFKGEKPGEVFEDASYVWPGEGDADVRRIVKDLLCSGYDKGFSIEPHMSVVFHDDSVESSVDVRYQTFIEYGRRFSALVEEVKTEIQI